MNTTFMGRTCQNWKGCRHGNNRRRRCKFTPEKYPSSGLVKNFCRNPSNGAQPWCYTTVGVWDYCDIPRCGNPLPTMNNEQCYKYQGIQYRGNKRTTKTGEKCQNWISQKPHSHRFTKYR